MNQMKKLSLCGIVLALMVLDGCIPMEHSTASPVPATSSPIPTMPTLESSPTNSPTVTIVTSLSVADANSRVHEYLMDSLNCRLPCWMGITPGQSTWLDLNTRLTTLDAITTDRAYKSQVGDWLLGGFTIKIPNDSAIMEVRSTYLGPVGEDRISVTAIDTLAYKLEDNPDRDLYGYPPYNDLLNAYTLSGILSTFGMPDQIYVMASLRSDTKVSPGFGDYFIIHLLYPGKGIFMEYKMPVEGEKSNYRFCPSLAWIGGYLIQSDLGAGYMQLLASLSDKYKYLLSPSQYIKTPEEAFGMTIQEFYQLFRSPTDQCLETPISIWWPK
jgi:hypothetical protein